MPQLWVPMLCAPALVNKTIPIVSAVETSPHLLDQHKCIKHTTHTTIVDNRSTTIAHDGIHNHYQLAKDAITQDEGDFQSVNNFPCAFPVVGDV